MENWHSRAIKSISNSIIPIQKIPATYDFKAVPGSMVHVDSFRAVYSSVEGHEVLYGSSDRGKGHIPPNKELLKAQQEKHLAYFKTITHEFKSANPTVSEHQIAELIGDMSIEASPSPGLGKIYLGSLNQPKKLQQHIHLPHEAERVFFIHGLQAPNYVSITGSETRESFAQTRSKNATYDGDRSYPMKAYTYSHKLSTGHIITFDRGHGCDHADTLQHPGILSTKHPNNYIAIIMST